ncbi:MAG TPA: hypothetical protein PKC89_05685 [Pyrinomonadaceae bacterium]|nr:hypothetical protein [Pyrinomonadaceae bacterium]
MSEDKFFGIVLLAFGLFFVIGNKLFYRMGTAFQQAVFGIKPAYEVTTRIFAVLMGILACAVAIWGLMQ